jgi:hypothetical protein
MGLETTVTTIDTLDASYPASTDPLSQIDDHLKNIKTALLNTFPDIEGAVTVTHGTLNGLDGRVTTLEDIPSAAITVDAGLPALHADITATEVLDTLGIDTDDDVTFATVTATTKVTSPILEVDSGGWTIEESSLGHLVFKHNGTPKFRMTSAGALTAAGDITASGTP